MTTLRNVFAICVFLVFMQQMSCNHGEELRASHNFAEVRNTQQVANIYYMLVFGHSKKCIDESAATTGAKVHQWDCHGGDNQRWKIQWNDDQTVSFISKASGRVLDVYWAGLENGERIHMWDWNGSNAQKFYLKPTNSGHFNIVNKGSNKCIQIAEAVNENGAELHQYDCHDAYFNQRVAVVMIGADS